MEWRDPPALIAPIELGAIIMQTHPKSLTNAARRLRYRLKMSGIAARVHARPIPSLKECTITIVLDNPTPHQVARAERYASRYFTTSFTGRSEQQPTPPDDRTPKVAHMIVKCKYSDEVRQEALDAICEAHSLDYIDLNDMPYSINVNGLTVCTYNYLIDTLEGIGQAANVEFWSKRKQQELAS